MPDSASRLPARASLEQLQKQAKELLRRFRAGDPAAVERLRDHRDAVNLASAQFVLAREYGFPSWAQLKHHIEGPQYDKLAQDLIAAFEGDAEAMQRLNDIFGNAWTPDQLRASVRERLAASGAAVERLTMADAQRFLAPFLTPAAGQVDWKENTLEPGLVQSDRDWEAVFALMADRGITGLRAAGRMTDAALERLCRLDRVTRLDLGGSLRLTDTGLLRLAQMPQLEELNLSGWKGRITDAGLEVLRHLPALRRFRMCWQQNVSDAGAANLACCGRLEEVNLLGTPTGDGAIRALAGKQELRQLRTGRLVTDAGLALFQGFPAFRTWQGGAIRYGLMSPDAAPTHLLVDGPFTDAGIASLAGLEGLFGLSFFWHSSEFTAAGLGPLKDLPNLGFLGCERDRCNDDAMRHIAAIPRLRMLMAQGTVAGDAGFAALSRSQTLEYLWGRECPNLGGRGFAALAAMPALRGLAVSCRNVDDAALSTLPDFPGLRELMPMDVPDAGFRHVGRCERLEGLWCMYCRDTGDAATAHIAGLGLLKTYYAGKTGITDRSLEVLGEMASLETLEFWQCAGITNHGVAHLASLPRLREITLDGSPAVTREAAALFPARVRVKYSA